MQCARLVLQAPMEKALAAQLKVALKQPLQDGFRTSFQQLLLPAFDAACQSLFSQVPLSLLSRFRSCRVLRCQHGCACPACCSC